MSKLRIATCCALLTLCLPTWCFAEKITVAWDANVEPSVTGYRLFYGTAPGVHPLSVDAGNTTTIGLTGLTTGQQYCFVVQAYSATQTSPNSNEVCGVALGVVSLTSTAASSTIPTGAPVTWTAYGSGGQALEYEFSRQDQLTGTWSVVQSYSSQNSFTWTPAIGQEGTYVIRVWVRVPGSGTPFDTQRLTSPFTVANGGVAIGAIEADVALPAPIGSPITFKAKTTGGPAPLQYRFYRLNRQTNTWSLVRDYSPVDSYTWTPTAGQQGSYTMQVWVRGAGSTATYDAFRSSDTFAIADAPPNIAVVKTDTSFPAATGAPITWKAVASGGPGPLEFRFYRFAYSTNTWTLAQDYGPSNTYTWTPAASDQGTYSLQAWVRRAGTTVVYDAWASAADFQIANSAAAIRSITTDAGAPMAAGAPVTWKVAAGGGPGALHYQFLLYSAARDSWSMVKDFSASNSFTWVPGIGEAGTYQLQVAIRPAGSTTVAASATTTPFDVVPNSMPAIVSVTRDTGTTLKPGMPIVWTAKVAGGLAPLEYAFARWNSATLSYTLLQGYSWDNSFGWMPTPGDLGSYVLQVFVRRAGSTAAYDTYTTTPTFVVN